MSASNTNIAWTDATWNPVTGCTKVSAGCKNCYAEAIAERFWGARKFTDVRAHVDRLDQPLAWRKPKRVFVNSMSDLFHEDVAFEFIDRVFAVMALAPQHTFQILTKRPHRMRRYFSGEGTPIGRVHDVVKQANERLLAGDGGWPGWPLRNVWLGVSCEDQSAADLRVPLLLDTPAAVRFLSCEPLLGELEISNWLHDSHCWAINDAGPCICAEPREAHVDWVIVGGESGPGYRPMDPAWASDLLVQCRAAGVPFFFKQGNGPRPGMNVELLGDLVQEFP
jgi:protein gp37